MRRVIIPLLAALYCFLAADACAKIIINPPPEVPSALVPRAIKKLTAERTALMKLYEATRGKIDSQERNCRSVEEGSPKVKECMAEASAVRIAVKGYRATLDRFKGGITDAKYAYSLIGSMNDLAKRLGWSAKERSRLDNALNLLDVDGAAATTDQIKDTWKEVLARGENGSFAREASQGEGVGFSGAGEQTKYQDCTIFALANAAGLPYGVVATRATELIRQGEWRKAYERADPQNSIERIGLNGGEVVMLAEAFGQAEVVPSSDFAKTLKEHRRVMVNVVPQGGKGGHEVVLTKVFQHGGENWYEMMDSNQGPQRRLYLSHKELDVILQENGVAYRPDPQKTPMLLR